MKRQWIAASLVAAGVASLGALAIAQPQERGGQPAAQPGSDMGMMLVQGLKATEGCLGTDLAQAQSGKNIIFAWFENKEAVVRWYNSPTHQGIMRGATNGITQGKPLAHVPDGTGPIMVIATITFTDAPKFEAVRMPISQISIELFEPLPGGAHLGGRLSPEKFKVEHMRDYTPATGAGTASGSAGG